MGATHLAGLGLSATALTFVAACFLGFTAAGLGAAVGLGSSLIGFGRLPGCGHLWLFGRLRGRFRIGFSGGVVAVKISKEKTCHCYTFYNENHTYVPVHNT